MAVRPPSDHLLRTFAAVPPVSRVLTLACADGRHAEPLALLGFDLYACDAREQAVDQTRARLATVWDADEAARRATRAHPHALGYPDDFFDWVVAVVDRAAVETPRALGELLTEARRVLRPGGWLYLDVPTDLVPGGDEDGLDALALACRYAQAEAPAAVEEEGTSRLRSIYRRVEADTPL